MSTTIPTIDRYRLARALRLWNSLTNPAKFLTAERHATRRIRAHRLWEVYVRPALCAGWAREWSNGSVHLVQEV